MRGRLLNWLCRQWKGGGGWGGLTGWTGRGEGANGNTQRRVGVVKTVRNASGTRRLKGKYSPVEIVLGGGRAWGERERGASMGYAAQDGEEAHI